MLSQILQEVETLWRKRTPAIKIEFLCPEDRVNRAELVGLCNKYGINPMNLDVQKGLFLLFDRLRKEFPNENWEKKRNWSAATKKLRKEMGLG